MPTRRLTVRAPLRFDAVRAELDVPAEFPAEVLAEAERAAAEPVLPAYDATDLPLVTVDPPGSRDLDQALHLAARPGGGFRVSYAIADVAAFVRPGGAVDAEARRRTQTLYSPDLRTPLHPPALGEGAASLLPDQVRPAVLWRIDLDPAGEVAAVDVRRALVRSRAQLDYPGLQAAVDAGTAPEPVALLPRVGELRTALARARHATELEVPEQEVVPAEGGGWTVQFRRQLPVERWNAQVSLLTGACAARLMLDAGIGLLRTLPAPRPEDVAALRRLAPALGVDWPAGAEPGDVISALDGATPGRRRSWSTRRCCCAGRRTRRWTGRRRPTRCTTASACRTRTSPRRSGGWSTGSAARSAWRSAPARRCRTGPGRRCRSCRR